MKIANLALLLILPLAGTAVAQPAPPATPKPCVMMPRQGPAVQPAAPRPRDRCAALAFPRR